MGMTKLGYMKLGGKWAKVEGYPKSSPNFGDLKTSVVTNPSLKKRLGTSKKTNKLGYTVPIPKLRKASATRKMPMRRKTPTRRAPRRVGLLSGVSKEIKKWK